MRREFVVSLFAMVIALGALTVPPSAVGAPDPGWGTPLPFEFTVGAVGEPEVAVDAEGNAVAVWNQPYGSASDNVVASRYVPGLGWGPVQVLDAFTASAARDPKVAMNAQGRAVAVWYEFDTDINDPELALEVGETIHLAHELERLRQRDRLVPGQQVVAAVDRHQLRERVGELAHGLLEPRVLEGRAQQRLELVAHALGQRVP